MPETDTVSVTVMAPRVVMQAPWWQGVANGACPALTAALLGLTLFACQPDGPRPIAYGEEPCTHCHMTLADPRFTAEAISSTGKTFVFDDVGCLASWLRESGTPIRAAWVASFVSPATWIPADSAVYLTTATLRTPMSSGLIALRPGVEADSVLAALGGTRHTWSEVRALAHEHPVAR